MENGTSSGRDGSVPEARLEDSGSGLAPAGDGWFVVNVRDAQWLTSENGGKRPSGSECSFESAQVDMEGRKLVFRRVAKTSESTRGFAEPAQKPYATKDGRHPAWGALKDITHLVPGVDLTEPAFPEWADLLDEKYGPEKR